MLYRHFLFKPMFILSAGIFLGCNNESGNTSKNVNMGIRSAHTEPEIASDSIDNFRHAVYNLVSIDYFVSGKDSCVTSKDPADFIEMNGIRYCFQPNSFGKSDTGLIAYRQVDKVRKFHVAKNRKQNGPSANIIEISFADSGSALKWIERLRKSKYYEIITVKPKTNIWHQHKRVYFIQSYHDPNRKVLNAITKKIKLHIK